MAIPGNAAKPDAITTTIKYITDTQVGPANGTIASYTSGLTNVPINVPVKLNVTAANPKDKVTKVAWAVSGPKGTKAKISDPAAAKVQFTPDLVGVYKVDATITTDGGTSTDSVQTHAGTFIGTAAGKCAQRHQQG